MLGALVTSKLSSLPVLRGGNAGGGLIVGIWGVRHLFGEANGCGWRGWRGWRGVGSLLNYCICSGKVVSP